MTKPTSFRIALMIAAAIAAGGCSLLKKGQPKTPVLGQRIPVLVSEGDVAVDPATHRVYFPLENVGGRPVLRVMDTRVATGSP